MTGVHVNVANLGVFGEEAGGFRYATVSGVEAIVVHEGLSVDEQATLIVGLCRAGEVPVYVNVPVQRQGEEDDLVLGRRSVVAARLRAGVAAASVIAASGCAGPLAGG